MADTPSFIPCSNNARSASPAIVSNQDGAHADVETTVLNHLNTAYRRPIADYSRTLFRDLDAYVRSDGRPIILDSGCGTGVSSATLAANHPDHAVIGIDKSATRIARASGIEVNGNLTIVRGDCVDLWRLAKDANWSIRKHYLLYPNPWPKAKHLKRRWHGHPIFGALIALGGTLELRSNWKFYVAEFEIALQTAGKISFSETFIPQQPLTPFEKKYAASGHTLYRLTSTLDSNVSLAAGGD